MSQYWCIEANDGVKYYQCEESEDANEIMTELFSDVCVNHALIAKSYRLECELEREDEVACMNLSFREGDAVKYDVFGLVKVQSGIITEGELLEHFMDLANSKSPQFAAQVSLWRCVAMTESEFVGLQQQLQDWA